MEPRIVDISHYNVIAPDGFKLAAHSGIWGVIHKCTQGTTYVDKEYAKRRQQVAKDTTMLWGAYHFATGDDVEEQVNHFVQSSGVEDHPNTLLALDYEANPSGSTMEPEQMVEFLRAVEQKVGEKAVLYSGNLLKETLSNLTVLDQQYVCSHRLWLAQYGPTPKIPHGFDSYWIWQYTGDGIGPQPHTIPGISIPGNPGIDLNTYEGSLENLISEWVGKATKTQPEQLPPQVVDTPVDPYQSIQDWFNSLIHKR